LIFYFFKKKQPLTNKRIHSIITYLIAAVWLANGLFGKILNLVPRHQEIVASILGAEYAPLLTILIGVAELVMMAWVLSRFQSKLNAITQIVVIGTMNILEFLLVPDLLLWGKFNSLFAFLFIGLIYYNEFILARKINNRQD
jgi:hypothetical protein